MMSFKKMLLMEDPDDIYPVPGDPSFLLRFEEARYTFLIYNDIVTNKKEWIAYDYSNDKVIASNSLLERSIYFEEKDKVSMDVYELQDYPAHSHLKSILRILNRADIDSKPWVLDGRLYEFEGSWYFPFWQADLNDRLRADRHLIDDFIHRIGVPTDKLLFEDEKDSEIFITYSQIFDDKIETSKPSEEQLRMKQMKFDLHVKKGMLDKAIVQALQSRPKDVNTLYQRLEKEFGMPVVQIKHLYGSVPLDKLIVKKAKELNEITYLSMMESMINESLKPTPMKRLNKAEIFFKKILGLEKVKVKVNLVPLTGDDGEIRYDQSIKSHVINISNSVNEDRQVRALAHELTHLQQIVTGKLDYNNRMWMGKSYVGVDYKIEPWESEARTSAAELWMEFNRAMRDGKI